MMASFFIRSRAIKNRDANPSMKNFHQKARWLIRKVSAISAKNMNNIFNQIIFSLLIMELFGERRLFSLETHEISRFDSDSYPPC
jgi:hypothetical protein